ncbi:MAG TPA: hypothetical protein VNV37_11715 [Solirubrobacteraceae bacterium]|jgi:hypothetical protein|nr:hypothetical protein [Solirubrobacteraceae bacterium]
MAKAVIANLRDRTTVDERTGAMHSVQAADLMLSERDVRALWSPENLERLARTYWRFLTRVTLGLVRVRYTDTERFVVLLFRPLTLLAFKAPEYELQPNHGVVRWRIERGLLVARAGRGSKGHLQIDVRRLPDESANFDTSGGGDPAGGRSTGARLHVEVEVANFHPAIASGISMRLYNATQARIHVFVTHGFLRSLARLDLARSRVGRLAAASQTARRRTAPAAWRGRGGR